MAMHWHRQRRAATSTGQIHPAFGGSNRLPGGVAALGHTVTTANHGEAALEVLAAGASFDAILMDRHMPVMGGITATKLIRQMDQPLASIPIIGVTPRPPRPSWMAASRPA